MIVFCVGGALVGAFGEWCGDPLLLLGCLLLRAWIAAYRGSAAPTSLGERRWLAAITLEELLLGLGAGYFVWAEFSAFPWPVLSLAGLLLLLGVWLGVSLPNGILPVRGRWARRGTALLGSLLLFAAGPSWYLLAIPWLQPRGELALAPRLLCCAASLMIGATMFLYLWTLAEVAAGPRGKSVEQRGRCR
jgi:ABC-type xylose transport system permease subunit